MRGCIVASAAVYADTLCCWYAPPAAPDMLFPIARLAQRDGRCAVQVADIAGFRKARRASRRLNWTRSFRRNRNLVRQSLIQFRQLPHRLQTKLKRPIRDFPRWLHRRQRWKCPLSIVMNQYRLVSEMLFRPTRFPNAVNLRTSHHFAQDVIRQKL